MSLRTLLAAIAAVGLMPLGAQAASCSAFAKIKSFDAAAKTVEVEFAKGREAAYFPLPDGSPFISKLPKKCRAKVTKLKTFDVTPTGGRLSVTQIRSNRDGKMLNQTDDNTWLPKQLEALIAGGETVAVVIRPGLGKDAGLGMTTVYLPITPEEEAEIKRIEAQAEDL